MLATSDASVNKLAQTGLSLHAVEEALIDTKAQQRMLWIDACRNEPGKGVGDARSFTKFQAASGTRILFSTKFGRVSYEDDEFQQGVFSHFLVEGLRGAAAKDDGWVSFRDLSDYVTDQVQSRTLRQGHPQVPFEGIGQSDASGDFPVARLSASTPQQAPAATPSIKSADRSFAEAMRDLQTGHSDLAYSEFEQYLTDFPNTELAAKAQYYLGEIDYNHADYSSAIHNFDLVLARYPENTKTADAHLMKAYALLKTNDRVGSIQEFRILVREYPHTDDARKAVQQLRSFGVSSAN
jgi:tetratricopeptide (TPR) repeat protein